MAEAQKKDFKVEEMQAHTLTWWRGRKDKIDMDPPYQRRGRLWSESDKAYLIDSILNGFDVPKVYMADFTWGDSALNKKKLSYAIIDGKQRMEAIFDFFEGTIVLSKEFVYLEDPQLRLSGLGYQDLKRQYPRVAETFEEYNLLVMRVVARSEEPINELFVRLNRSKPLTGAEIRNAMVGPAPAVIRQIAKHEFFNVNLAFPVSRGQDLNAAAKFLFFEYNGKLGDTKKAALDEFVKTAKASKDKVELAGRKVVDVLDDMNEIFLPKDPLLTSAGVIPVYYWLVQTCRTNEYSYLRGFLVRFEDGRRANRVLTSQDPKGSGADRDLLEYDQYNRSTNDARSHEGRFEILLRRFRARKPTKSTPGRST